MTELELVKRQLLSIRDLADTTLAMLGVVESLDAEHGECAHPEPQRTPAGVMGDPGRFFCKLCQRMVAGSGDVVDAATKEP